MANTTEKKPFSTFNGFLVGGSVDSAGNEWIHVQDFMSTRRMTREAALSLVAWVSVCADLSDEELLEARNACKES